MNKKLPKKNTIKLGGGQLRKASGQNSESLKMEAIDLSLVFDEPNFIPKNLMEAVVERSNMIKAVVQVERNKGAPGVDGLKAEELKLYFAKHWQKLRARLLAGIYLPSPIKRVEIPKADGGVRKLGIPTVVDRVIQQAINQILSEIFEPTFSENSYGFRPKRSANQAVAKAQSFAASGRRYVVDLDLEKFFDRVNHDLLMERIARRIQDKRVLKTIRRYLEAGVMIGGLEEMRREGTPQGGPLSPLLSNILLDELDQELERRGHKFCRYADDCNIYVQSQKAGDRVKASVTVWLKRHLKLTVNETKSAVDLVSKRKFLGYSMTSNRVPKLKPASQSIVRFKAKIRDLFRKARGRNVERFIKADLNPVLRGWINYFGSSRVKRVFEELDSWLRRKLRCVLWRQWKKPATRMRKLIACGLNPEHAKKSTSNGRGAWWNSGQRHMSFALPGKYFDQLGLINLQSMIARKAS